nr:MAG TPA: hypothetical protein [Caudoviricetes sp.]
MKTTIKFPKSDSFAFFVTINKIAKALDNAFFTVKENPDEEPVLQKKLGAGISLADSRLYKNQLSYKVQIDGADTQLMEVGVRYFFDVKGTIGNAQKTFLWGELILSETETGYLNPAIQGDTTAVAQVYTATFETGAQSQYVETESDPVAMAKIGDMTKLNTTAKDTIVKAINEVNAPTFTEATTLKNIASGDKQSTLWGKVKKWFSSLKALAFKDKVGTADFAMDAKCPSAYDATNATNATFTDFTNKTYSQSAQKNLTITESGFYHFRMEGAEFGVVYWGRGERVVSPISVDYDMLAYDGTNDREYILTINENGKVLVYIRDSANENWAEDSGDLVVYYQRIR